MPWVPEYDGEVPTLGYEIIQWVADHLVIPDGDLRGQPFVMTEWQQQFTVDFYALDPTTGKRINRRGAAILSKGIGKSPWAATLATAEFVGPVVFDGWDSHGRPVGRRWETPWIQIAATAEDQTDNTYSSLHQMIQESDRLNEEYPEIDAGRTRIYMRGNLGAKIEPVTSEAGTREGQRITFAVMDETGLWIPRNGGVSLASTIRRNVAKTGGSSIETSNSYVPGEDSVAEATATTRTAMLEGRTKSKTGIVYLHAQAPADTDLSDRDSLIAGLKQAYMDTPWIDYERLVEEIYDPATDPADARRFYLNQIVSAQDSWVSIQDWDACASDDKAQAGDAITLGFDGSLTDDSTALIGCRVSDGLLFPLGIWEKPEGPAGDNWQVDREEVDAAVFKAFETYDVIAFYADPPHWQDYIDKWTAEFGKRLKVKAVQRHPIEWWTNRLGAMVAALERAHTAIVTGDMKHANHPTLNQHILNAKRKKTRSGVILRKEFPGSPRKIDAAMAAVLAYEARSNAVSKNVKQGSAGRAPIRVR